MKVKNKLYSLEYYKHLCKVQQKHIDWLHYLFVYERECNSTGGYEIESTEKMEYLRDDFFKEEKEFNKIYNI